MVPLNFVAAVAGHRRRQPQPQPQPQQQQQQQPWATWATWQDVYPRLEHPANAAERRTLSMSAEKFRLDVGQRSHVFGDAVCCSQWHFCLHGDALLFSTRL